MDGYFAVRWIFKGILRLGFGLTVTGEEQIHAGGPVVLAVNRGS